MAALNSTKNVCITKLNAATLGIIWKEHGPQQQGPCVKRQRQRGGEENHGQEGQHLA